MVRLKKLLPVACLALCSTCAHPAAPQPSEPATAAATNSGLTYTNPDAGAPVPELRLASDTRPLAESIELQIDPAKDRFSGVADIEISLDRPRSVLFLHGRDLTVSRATITPEHGSALSAIWQQRDGNGTASLTAPQEVPAGKATLHIEYDAAYNLQSIGLFKIKQGGIPYTFTQFESIDARRAFPCFDEPGFKIPYQLTLIVPASLNAVANTQEQSRTQVGDLLHIQFTKTLPLPSYLVAFAVGPLEIVRGPDVPPNEFRSRPLQFRVVTTQGHGKDASYAVNHTGELVTLLEQFFKLEFPFDKLDLWAVPDQSGAMENAGAISFHDSLLLFDEKTLTRDQKQNYASVVTHELAHQWVGDLVTAAWWDDIWLNEAFATWVASEVVAIWDHDQADQMELLISEQTALWADGLVSARAVRQPIKTVGDIENSFDSITYQKGGALLEMFQRWVGPADFRRGLHDYLLAHRLGNSTADDFLDAESKAAGRDVKTPFRAFLDQPGEPFLETMLECDAAGARLHIKQRRYLPLGSKGDLNKIWQVPVCAKFQVGEEIKEACSLLTASEGDLPLGKSCPSWVFPNPDFAGYYRFGMAPADLAQVRTRGFASLNQRERVAYGYSLATAQSLGSMPMAQVLEGEIPLATDPHPSVASFPMGMIYGARKWLYATSLRPAVEAFARELFQKQAARLGWDPKPLESHDQGELRVSVLWFLAEAGNDPAVRAEAKKRGLAWLGDPKGSAVHPEVIDPNLLDLALQVLGEEADRPLWDAVHARLAKTEDTQLRGDLITLLVAPRAPELSRAALELSFDPVLRPSETLRPFFAQLYSVENQDVAWTWMTENFDRLVALRAQGGRSMVQAALVFCEHSRVKPVEDFLTPRIAKIDGGPRLLAASLESIELCALRRDKQEPSGREFFSNRR